MGVAALVAVLAAAVLLPDARRRVAGAVLGLATLAAVAAPNAIFLSLHAHHVRLEGKSAINFTIARRMATGLSYTVAADAIDARLDRVGPELADDYYLEPPPGQPRASLGGLLALAAGDARRHLVDIPRVLLSRAFGTPIVALLALYAFIRGRRTRERLALELVPLAVGIALFVALASVAQFWERYSDGFIPLMALWAGRGAALAREDLFRRIDARAVAAVAAVLLVAMTGTLRQTFRENVNDGPNVTERLLGAAIAARDPHPGTILSVSDQSVFYAGGRWEMLPWAPDAKLALAYLRRVDPRYVVVDPLVAVERPYVADWLRAGIPDPHAHLVTVIGGPQAPVAAVYRWSP
jgi:hypothetical protein